METWQSIITGDKIVHLKAECVTGNALNCDVNCGIGASWGQGISVICPGSWGFHIGGGASGQLVREIRITVSGGGI